jgi:hypothetical protein
MFNWIVPVILQGLVNCRSFDWLYYKGIQPDGNAIKIKFHSFSNTILPLIPISGNLNGRKTPGMLNGNDVLITGIQLYRILEFDELTG